MHISTFQPRFGTTSVVTNYGLELTEEKLAESGLSDETLTQIRKLLQDGRKIVYKRCPNKDFLAILMDRYERPIHGHTDSSTTVLISGFGETMKDALEALADWAFRTKEFKDL